MACRRLLAEEEQVVGRQVDVTRGALAPLLSRHFGFERGAIEPEVDRDFKRGFDRIDHFAGKGVLSFALSGQLNMVRTDANESGVVHLSIDPEDAAPLVDANMARIDGAHAGEVLASGDARG